MTEGERDLLRGMMMSRAFKAAREEVVAQVMHEEAETLRTANPLSDNQSLENLLRAQGFTHGALRVFDIMDELARKDGGRDDSDD